MDAPNEFQPLIDDIFREKVLRARREKRPGVLSLEGFDLHEMALRWTRDFIRSDRPQATPEEVEAEVARRLAIKRRIDEYGIYNTAPSGP